MRTFLILYIFSFGIITLSPASAADNQTSKEWSLYPPKANDPSVFPNPDETSVDLGKLQAANSLGKIYDLASEMRVSSVSDNKVVSKAVSDYMFKCCSDYDHAIQEIRNAGFKEINDTTQYLRTNSQAFELGDLKVDKSISSEQRSGLNLFNSEPAWSEYKIYLFFNEGKLVKAIGVIFPNETF